MADLNLDRLSGDNYQRTASGSDYGARFLIQHE
jgi:hypothetical protein